MKGGVLSRVLCAAAAFVVVDACRSDSTPERDPVAFASLGGDVELRRDARGVPHVVAHSLDDALFALGWATAQDRLFALDVNRRRALGEMAELFGEDSLADDEIARTVGFAALGEADARDLHDHDPDIYRALSAYAAGINTFVADAENGKNGARLPPEYADIDPAYRPDPWRVEDTLAVLKAELFILAAHPESDLVTYAMMLEAHDGPAMYRDLYAPDPLEKVYVTPGFPTCSSASRKSELRVGEPIVGDATRASAVIELARAFAHFSRRPRVGPVGASNNWALCGARTQSGATMLANDPHLGLDLPSNLYEFHIESDDTIGAPGPGVHLAGFGIPGAPAVVLGHDDAAAWGVTTVEADVAESYLETTDGDAVLFQGKTVPMITRTETIRVRKDGRPVAEHEDTDITVRIVPHHGPILSDAVPKLQLFLGDKQALSMKWLGFEVTHESRAFYDLLRAQSFDQFKSALAHFQSGLLNFVYADVSGHIGYYPHADYPIRARLDPMNPPYGVVPGTGDYEWTGALIPNDCIPQLFDPPECRIFTANNDPAGVSDDGNTLNDAFYLGGTFDYGLRARRIRDRLDLLAVGGGKASLDDLESIQGDVRSGLADHFLPPLLAAAKAGAPSAAASKLLAELQPWDRMDNPDAIEPTIFAAFYSQLLVDVFADDLPLTFSELATDDRIFARALEHLLAGQSMPSGHDYLRGKRPNDVLLAALEEIALSLPKALGTDETKWTWGSVHTNTFNHPLAGKYDLGPVPLGGGLSSVDAARYSPTHDGDPTITADVFEGPNARIVVELKPGAIAMRTTLPTGESGVLGDPHYADQLDAWRTVQGTASPFTLDEVRAQTTITLKFSAGLAAPD